jgi:hypothetical protein
MTRWRTGLVLLLGLVGIGCNREDYSTPKKAARTFYVALMSGETARAANGLADPAQAAVLPDIDALVKEILAARDAAVQKFGKSGETVDGGIPSLDDLDGAAETITGQTATVCPNDNSKLSISLKQIGSQWKVDLLETFSIDGRDITKARQVIQAAKQSVAEHVQRIRNGKYRDAAEAETALAASIRNPLMMEEIMRKVGDLLGGTPKGKSN